MKGEDIFWLALGAVMIGSMTTIVGGLCLGLGALILEWDAAVRPAFAAATFAAFPLIMSALVRDVLNSR